MDKESELKYELIDATLGLIQLATRKGFDSTVNVKSFMLEPWMDIRDIFANTVCAAIQWWLRSKHGVQLTITPTGIIPQPVIYKWYANYYKQDGSLIFDGMSDQYFEVYELACIDGLKYALNALPPAAQEHH